MSLVCRIVSVTRLAPAAAAGDPARAAEPRPPAGTSATHEPSRASSVPPVAAPRSGQPGSVSDAFFRSFGFSTGSFWAVHAFQLPATLRHLREARAAGAGSPRGWPGSRCRSTRRPACPCPACRASSPARAGRCTSPRGRARPATRRACARRAPGGPSAAAPRRARGRSSAARPVEREPLVVPLLHAAEQVAAELRVPDPDELPLHLGQVGVLAAGRGRSASPGRASTRPRSTVPPSARCSARRRCARRRTPSIWRLSTSCTSALLDGLLERLRRRAAGRSAAGRARPGRRRSPSSSAGSTAARAGR